MTCGWRRVGTGAFAAVVLLHVFPVAAFCNDPTDVVGYSRCDYHAYGRSFGPSPFDVDLDVGAFHAWMRAGDRPTPFVTERGTNFGSGALTGSFDGGTVSADIGLSRRLYVPIVLAIGTGHVTAANGSADGDFQLFTLATGAGVRLPFGGGRLRVEVDLGLRGIAPSNKCNPDNCLSSILLAPVVSYDLPLSDYWRLTAHVSTEPFGAIPFEAGLSIGIATRPIKL